MTDRETVIAALEYCAVGTKDCAGCPMKDDCKGVSNGAMAAAARLLKEQEPRVLTWDEVKKAEVCWLEDRGYEPFATLEADTWNPEKYGKSYRCWNRMPTDEQRKMVKWND